MNAMERQAIQDGAGRDGRRQPATLDEIEHQAELMSHFAASMFTAARELGDFEAAKAANRLAWEMIARDLRRADRWRRAWAAAGWWMLGAACGVAAWAIAGGL